MKNRSITFLAVFILLSTSAFAALDLSPGYLSVGVSAGDSNSASIVLRNTGNQTLTDVGLSYNSDDFRDADGQLGVQLIPNFVPTLAPGAVMSIKVAISAPSTILQTSATTKTFQGVITGDSEEGQTDTFTLNINVQNLLRINDVEINSAGDDEEIEPGEEFTIKVEIENVDDDIDFEDCNVKVKILDGLDVLEDEDGDEVEDDVDIDRLKSENDETVEFTFIAPYTIRDSDEYVVEAYAECKNEDDRNIIYTAIDDSLIIDGIKEDHAIEIFRSNIDQQTLTCNRVTNLNVGVRNIGEKDEDIELTVTNSKLGINRKTDFELSEDPRDDDSQHMENIIINAENADPGSYRIDIVARFDDGDDKETASVTLEVKECPLNTEDNQVDKNGDSNTKRDDKVEVITVPSNIPTQRGVEAQTLTNQLNNDNLLIGVLIAVIAILFVGFIVAIIKMSGKKKRRH